MNLRPRRLATSLLSISVALPLSLAGLAGGPASAITGQAAEHAPAAGPPSTDGPGGDPQAGWKERLETHRTGVREKIAETAAQMWDRESTVSGRALMSVVATELRDDKDPAAAWEVLQLIFDHQNMDPTAENYGMFPGGIWGNCWYGLRCYQLAVAPYTRTTPGSSASFSQTADIVEPGEHVLTVKLRNSYLYASEGYHYLQAVVNGQVVWEEDVTTTEETWRDISVDVTDAIGTADQASVEMRLLEKRAVSQLPVTIHFDEIGLSGTNLVGDVDRPGVWTEGTTGEGVTVGMSSNGSSDINSSSFTLLMFAGILNSADFSLFTAQQQDEIKERVRAASHSTIDDDFAQLGYTNARLIRDVQMMLVGQALGDDALYEQGLAFWREWLAYTREHGIREYGSPVYYGIDLGALMMGHSYIADDEVRPEFARALDLFWYDIAANFFPGRESLSGSHSRDYDFTHGTGPVSYFLTIEGWESMPLYGYTTFNYQVIQSYYGDHVYHPNRHMYELALTPVKEVTARTDPNPFLDRYNYVTPNWALGSTSETFTNVIPGAGGPTPYDKAINLELAGDRTTGTISIVPSWNTDPYGKIYGGSAPLHAPLFPTTAQDRGSLLTQLDLNPAGQRVPEYTTSVLLPATADLVLLDGEPVDMSSVGETSASLTSTVVVKVDQACAVIRSLGAKGIHGQTPTAALVVDEAGLDLGMARFAITQFSSETSERLKTESAPVTMYLEAADCADAEAARALGEAVASAPVSMNETETVRTAIVTTPDGTVLEVATDLVARDPLYRHVDGEPMRAPSILTVNGTDFAHVLAPPVTIEGTTDAEEPGTDGEFTFTRPADGAAEEVTVAYSITDGRYTRPGRDYEALDGEVTFAAGETTATEVVGVIDRRGPSPRPRFVEVTIEPGDGYEVGDPATARVGIVSDGRPGD